MLNQQQCLVYNRKQDIKSLILQPTGATNFQPDSIMTNMQFWPNRSSITGSHRGKQLHNFGTHAHPRVAPHPVHHLNQVHWIKVPSTVYANHPSIYSRSERSDVKFRMVLTQMIFQFVFPAIAFPPFAVNARPT
jgi:hypothetical protein